MNRAILSVVVAVLFSVLSYAQSAPEYSPSGSIRNYFLGAWKLISTENRYPDGHSTPYRDLGADSIGFLMYTPSGHMCAQLMKHGRQRWVDDSTPTNAEAALGGFVSYCGTFELPEGEHTMVHHPETAWSPNWPGTFQKRPYHLVSEDRFFFRGESKEKQKDGTEIPVTWTITWERLK